MAELPVEFSEEDTEFLTILGRFTALFAIAETGLDFCNVAIFKHCGGDSVEPEIPRSLERKVAFFKDCHKKCPKLQSPDITSSAAYVAEEFTKIRIDRHFLIHGIGTKALKDRTMSFMKLAYQKTHLRPEENELSLDLIIELDDRSMKLSRELLAYSLFFLDSCLRISSMRR
jgi:hypothetical protein